MFWMKTECEGEKAEFVMDSVCCRDDGGVPERIRTFHLCLGIGENRYTALVSDEATGWYLQEVEMEAVWFDGVVSERLGECVKFQED